MNEKLKRILKALPWCIATIFLYWGMFYIATLDYSVKRGHDTKELPGAQKNAGH